MEAACDDDFGELYADIEVQPTSASDFARLYIDPQEADAKSEDAKLNEEEFPSDAKNNDSVCDKLTRFGSEGSEHDGGKEVNDGYVGSDSEDDLNIVLNDEDCPDFPVGGVRNRGVVAGVGCDEDGDDDGFVVVTEGANSRMNGKCDDQTADGSELVSKNAMKGGYGSPFFRHKYMRAPRFVNNVKANMSMGMGSYCSALTKGRWNGNACIQNQASSSCHVAAANLMMVQYGYGSFLPWYWSIFDVNIDRLEDKPWRVPGVDITDYFNFGFNENTWKQYCASLEQLWKTSMQTGIPVVDEPVKLNQEAMREQIDQVVSGSVLSPSSECELPKGRAIQVEDSLVERQPSIGVRRPCSRDSDVIIQIKVLESPDNCSGSRNSIVMDASLEGESIVGNNRNFLSSSSEHDDVPSEEQLEGLKKSEDSSVKERNGLIPGVNEDEHRDQADQSSEDSAEALGGEIKAEEDVGIDTCNTDPCWNESKLSLSDQELSLTSYNDSDSEATENSVHVDKEKSHGPLRRQSVNSVTDLKESFPHYHKTSKNTSFNRKPVKAAYFSRNRGPFQHEWRHQIGRHEPGSELKKDVGNDNYVSPILLSSTRDLSLLDHQFVDNDRRKEQLHDFGGHKRRDVSYNRERKQSCYYGGEKVVDDLGQTVHTKYSYRGDRESFRENTKRYVRINGDEREYVFEPRTLMTDSEYRKRDWYHADGGRFANDLSPRSFRESRSFLPKCSSFPSEGRDTQRRRINEKSHFRDRRCNNDQWFDECEFEYPDKSYSVSCSSTEIEMECLDIKHEWHLPQIDGEWKRCARRGRHHHRLPLDLENLWSGKTEGKYKKYTHHQTSNLSYFRQSYTDSVRNNVHDTRVNENFGECGRHKHARDNRDSDRYCGYTDAAEDEDFIIHSVEEHQFYRPPSQFLNWTEDGITFRDHETHATSLHSEVQIDDIKFQQRWLHRPRRGSESFLKGSSKIMCRGKRGQPVLRCRKSVDFVNGEIKSHTKSSRIVSNGRLENVDLGIAKKRRALAGFDKSHNKASKLNISKSRSNHAGKKWLQNLPDKVQEESSDIGEGQIVTQEPHMEASVYRRDVSEGATPSHSVTQGMSKFEDNSEQFIGGYDSQRILDSLAKMEKRRERFNQPVTVKKEAEESLKLNSDSIVDTGEAKQQRPARKRRWLGS